MALQLPGSPEGRKEKDGMLNPAKESSAESERRRHRDAVDVLTKQLRAPFSAISKVYESELDRLNRSAKVREYLHLLVSKNVRDRFRSS